MAGSISGRTWTAVAQSAVKPIQMMMAGSIGGNTSTPRRRSRVIGTSSRGDGVEDTWTYPAPSTAGETMVVTSRHRDRVLDHREYFRGETLLRTEDDTNGDGRIDQWQRYDGPVLREAAFDTSFQRGRADRRVQYDEKGRFAYVEEDADGDGKFVRVDGVAAPVSRPPGVEKR